MKPLEKKHRNDLILIAVLLAAAGIAFGIIQLGKKSGGYAVVVQDGKEVATYPLNVDTSVTINSPTGFQHPGDKGRKSRRDRRGLSRQALR